MGGVGAFDLPAARMGVVDVNRKGRQSCGQLLIEGILGLSCLTRRGWRIGPAGLTPGPSAGRAWGPVAHLASQMGVSAENARVGWRIPCHISSRLPHGIYHFCMVYTMRQLVYIMWYIPCGIYHVVYTMQYTMIYSMVYTLSFTIWYIPWYIP
jgi:hypothetical protein